MSIATDEAEQWAQSRYSGLVHIENIDGRPVIVPNFPQKTNLRREGYIAGRTAEITTFEVEECAYALWKAEVNMASLNPTESDIIDAWEKLSIQQRDMYRSKARTVLEAERKAVTE